MAFELPDDDDFGPGFNLPTPTPHHRPPAKKRPASCATSSRPQREKKSSKSSAVQSSSAVGSCGPGLDELPPDDDGDLDLEGSLQGWKFSPHSVLAGSPDEQQPLNFEDNLWSYDSPTLKLAARKIPSLATHPFEDLESVLANPRPVDPAVQCTLWEIYSVPRLSPKVRELGGSCRRTYDLRNFWDLNEIDFQRTLLVDVSILQPHALMLSPPCTWVSMLMHSNWARVAPAKRVLNLTQALNHIDFSMWLAEYQDSHNRFFVFEHPAGSLAWERDSVA